MSNQWLCPRGHVIRTNTGGGGGGGYYHVSGISGKADVIITDIQSGGQDIIGTSATLGGGKTLYAFGKAFGSLTITGYILLGDCLGQSSPSVQALESWFNKHRITIAKKPVSVSYGHAGGGKSIYPMNLQMQGLDNARHIQPFAIACVVVEI